MTGWENISSYDLHGFCSYWNIGFR